jgi:hypothetical protein
MDGSGCFSIACRAARVPFQACIFYALNPVNKIKQKAVSTTLVRHGMLLGHQA